MILHRQVALGMLAVLFLAGAVFCYAGYSMVASFSVTDGSPGRDRAAVVYGLGVICGLAGALGAAVAAWRADHR